MVRGYTSTGLWIVCGFGKKEDLWQDRVNGAILGFSRTGAFAMTGDARSWPNRLGYKREPTDFSGRMSHEAAPYPYSSRGRHRGSHVPTGRSREDSPASYSGQPRGQ